MHGRRARLWTALLIGVSLVGCSRSLATVDPTPTVPARAYDRVLDAAADVLRDMRFVINRDDRRFGVMTTEPRIAPSVLEPWHPENTTAEQIGASTVNLQRRRVRIKLKPIGNAGTPRTGAKPGGQGPEDAERGASRRYGLGVEVAVERQHHPPEQLHTAALGRVRTAEAGRRYRPLVTEAGRLESYWRRVGDDPYLERRLVRAILREAGVKAGERDRPDARPSRPRPVYRRTRPADER